jgi:hypothetical protein
MNQKAAKLARRINRKAGTLVKVSKVPVNDRGVRVANAHKVPRKVKRWWASLTARDRGKASAHWRRAVPYPKKATEVVAP